MSEIISLSLGGRTFEVPPFPLEITIPAYPLCQKLTNADLQRRIAGIADGPFELTGEEMNALTELAFYCANAADPALDTQTFLSLPVTPMELFAAFSAARVQCGGWYKITREGGEQSGEPSGAPSPTSTSTESSPDSSGTSTSPKNTG